MALTLTDLKTIMAPLTELGKGEATFEVNGLHITVRSLTPEEEIATQRFARGALTEGDANDQVNALDYLDRFRTACLGYALVQIGELDFRGVSTVETGEKLPNGVAVKVKKNEALMQVIESWSRPMTTAIFQRFTSLMERIESSVDKSLKFDDDHIDAEIARLEERLAELKATKTKKIASANDPRDNTRELASNKKPTPPAEPKPEEPVTWENARQNRSTDEPASFVAIPNDVAKAVVDETSVSVEAVPTPPAAPTPIQPVAEAAAQTRKPVFGNRPPVREPAKDKGPPDPLQDVQSSLVDTDDPAEIDAENRRLMAERAARMRPPPPHLTARDVAQSIEQVGMKDGIPVFARPAEDLNPETAKPAVRTPPPVVASNVNPKFRPAGK